MHVVYVGIKLLFSVIVTLGVNVIVKVTIRIQIIINIMLPVIWMLIRTATEFCEIFMSFT